MIYIHLLFHTTCEYLGEIITRNGVFDHAALSSHGTEVLEGAVDDWRTSGVPVRFESIDVEASDGDILFGVERVPVHDVRFVTALQQWMFDRGYHIVPLKEEHRELWDTISLLPLGLRERFAVAAALSKTTRPQMDRWMDALEATLRVYRESERHIEEQLEKKQSAAVKRLIKQYA